MSWGDLPPPQTRPRWWLEEETLDGLRRRRTARAGAPRTQSGERRDNRSAAPTSKFKLYESSKHNLTHPSSVETGVKPVGAARGHIIVAAIAATVAEATSKLIKKHAIEVANMKADEQKKLEFARIEATKHESHVHSRSLNEEVATTGGP